MSSVRNELTVFTKPWPGKSLEELGAFVKGLGFDGVELPVRPNFQVTPEAVEAGLPEAAGILRDQGVKIASIAGPTDEKTIAACAAAGVPVIRVCERIDLKKGYAESEKEIRARYDRLVPALEDSGVRIGVQNHCGLSVGSAVGTMHLIERYDPEHVAAVLDVAHCGLDGEPDEMAIDVVWSHLCMVNLKNAIRRLVNGPESEEAQWKVYWTTGRHGLASWSKTIEVLGRRGFSGPLCLTAEYSDHDAVDRLIREDIAYAKLLLAD